MWGAPAAPPAEVAADPARRELWDKQHNRTPSGHVVYQAEGCGHEVFYSCGRANKGGSRPMCAATSYHTRKPLPPLSALATLSLSVAQWTPIDAPPIAGHLQSFDVDANLDCDRVESGREAVCGPDWRLA